MQKFEYKKKHRCARLSRQLSISTASYSCVTNNSFPSLVFELHRVSVSIPIQTGFQWENGNPECAAPDADL